MKMILAESLEDENQVNGNLKICHDLYPRRCLDEAIEAYQSHCSFQIVREASDSTILSIEARSTEYGNAIVVGEFLNYLLDLSARDLIRGMETA